MTDYRAKNDLTQRYIAYKMGVSQQAVEKWESGKSMPSIKRLNKLANLLGCTIEQILSDEEDDVTNEN